MTGAPLFDAKPGAQRSASAWLQRAQAQNAALSLGAGARGLPAAGTSLSAATASAPGAISGAKAKAAGVGPPARLPRLRRQHCVRPSSAMASGWEARWGKLSSGSLA